MHCSDIPKPPWINSELSQEFLYELKKKHLETFTFLNDVALIRSHADGKSTLFSLSAS